MPGLACVISAVQSVQVNSERASREECLLSEMLSQAKFAAGMEWRNEPDLTPGPSLM